MPTNLLRWREGAKEDRSVLPAFTCTEDASKRRRPGRQPIAHAAPWELRVQSKIRSLRPPYKLPVQMLVGEDAHGIGAVALFEELRGPEVVDLSYMAIAHRLRFKGGGVADEMAATTWEAIERRALEQEVRVVLLVTSVDEHNEASQKLCRRMHMAHTGMISDTVQQWSATHILGEFESPSEE